MIPRVIHYCWFGGKAIPEEYKSYMASWKKYCPDFVVKEWNESNFDINCCNYVREAYLAKKWAFVADYARFAILYKYGGLYFDTDVEILKPLDDLLTKGSFMGTEIESMNNGLLGISLAVNPGLGIAATPGLGLYREILDIYENIHFCKHDGRMNNTTVVEYVTNLLKQHGWVNENKIQNICDINIYSSEYFSPMNQFTGVVDVNEHTCTIHHYSRLRPKHHRHKGINQGKLKELQGKHCSSFIVS